MIPICQPAGEPEGADCKHQARERASEGHECVATRSRKIWVQGYAGGKPSAQISHAIPTCTYARWCAAHHDGPDQPKEKLSTTEPTTNEMPEFMNADGNQPGKWKAAKSEEHQPFRAGDRNKQMFSEMHAKIAARRANQREDNRPQIGRGFLQFRFGTRRRHSRDDLDTWFDGHVRGAASPV